MGDETQYRAASDRARGRMQSQQIIGILGTGCLGLAGPASAFDDYTGPFGATTSLYGQLSPSVLVADDGQDGLATVADNSNSVSRVGLKLRRRFDLGEFQLRFETALGVRESKTVSQLGRGEAWNWQRTDIRFVDASFQFGTRGTFSIGHGSMATDQIAMADLSGTTLATSVSVPDMAGGMIFRTQSGGLSGISVKTAFNTFDGIRRARLRYDFRPRHGMTLSISAGSEVLRKNSDELNFDAGLSYVGVVRGVEVEGAVGASLTSLHSERTRKDLVGSVSLRHQDSGVNLTLAAGQGSAGGLFHFIKLGLRRDWFSIGHTALSADYHIGYDIALDGSTSRAAGLGLVQHVEDLGVDLFLGWRRYGLAGTGLHLQDIDAVQVGARWRF